MSLENKLKSYYGKIIVLIKSIEGKNLAGKVFRNNQGVKDAWLRTAEDMLLKMVEIDENSTYVEDIRKKLYGGKDAEG